MEIKKTITKTYKVIAIKRNFCKFDESFRQARLKYHHDKSMNCFNCRYRFVEGDNINIFFMAKDGNKLCCDACANDAQPEDSLNK